MKNIICILILLKSIDAAVRVDPLVDTPNGLYKGVLVDHYAMFLGVPYAVVDENNPFGDASPHPGFSTLFEAYNNTISCPQSRSSGDQSIHCLLLNIYVPNTATSANTLPVMVFVHGGGFEGGNALSSASDTSMLLKHNVIVVTINYRLGPYGFLCLSVPGYNNQGLKDQALAFKWVKENIKYFGGDDENLTVFGQSAGAMAIDIHLHAKEGLFKRAILQSGSALTPFCTAAVNDTVPINIARNLGYDSDSVQLAMDVLKSTEVAQVMKSAEEIGLFSSDHPILKPCAEYNIDDENRYLLDHPENLQPKVRNMDILIGHTNKEQNMYSTSQLENYDFDFQVKRGFDDDVNTDFVEHFYIGGNNLGDDSKSEIVDFASDFAFNYPAERSYERYIKENARSVYRYVFSQRGSQGLGPRSEDEWVGHGGEMQFLFSNALSLNEDDKRMADLMTTMWTNFAKFGNPTPPDSDISPTWPAVNEQRPYLNIKFPLAVEYRVFHDRMSFWDVYYKLYETKVKGFKANI